MLQEILKNSLINCHAVGLDSIVLKPAPNMVRVFITRENHSLWRNNPDTGTLFSIGIHPHHCDVTMVPLTGGIANIVLGSGSPTHKLHQFEYHSGITDRVGAQAKASGSGFMYTGKDVRVCLKHQPLRYPTTLMAKEMHSVYVPKGKRAAWLICEGREWPDYQPVTLSNYRLDEDYSAVEESLYKPMTQARLLEYMEWIGVHAGELYASALS